MEDKTKQKKETIDIRDVYMETTKTIKQHTVNWIKRYGYWSMVIVLFFIALALSFITVGDVYKRASLTQEEVIQKYIEACDITNSQDVIIVTNLVIEAYAKDEILSQTEYKEFVKNVKSYNYDNVRFDSIAFYLFTKEPQQFIQFQELPKWKIMLVVMTGILGVLVTITLMQTGIQDALATSFMKDKKNEHKQTSAEAAKYRLDAEDYFSRLHTKQLESVRRTELSKSGLIYEDYFDEQGRLKQEEYLDVVKKVLNSALSLRVKHITFNMIATSLSSEKQTEEKFVSIKHYASKTALKSIVLKTGLIVFFVFVSISLVVSAQDPLQAFMSIISTILMFAAGILEYLAAYSFIIDEYSESIDSKIRHLNAFIEDCKHKQYKQVGDTNE